MKNPGLKRNTPSEPFLKVTHRRTATPPPMAAPKTNTTNPYTNPIDDLDLTRTEDVETPPPLMGGSSTPPVGVTNGSKYGGVPESGAPLAGSVPMRSTLSPAAEQRRIDTQKQVGGGAKENEAYEDAQDDIREKMQVRRDQRVSALYPVERPTLNELGLDVFTDSDFPAGRENRFQAQPMFDLKEIHDRGDENDPDYYPDLDASANHKSNGGGCETCWLSNGLSDQHSPSYDAHHMHKPFTDMGRYSSTQRTSALIPIPRSHLQEIGLQSFQDSDFSPGPGNPTRQPMMDVKDVYDGTAVDHGWDAAAFNSFAPGGCETCYLKHGDGWHNPDAEQDHEKKPFSMGPGERYSSVQRAYDRQRHEWLYDVDHPDYFKNDPAPSNVTGHSGELFTLKVDDPYEITPQFLEEDGTVKPGRDLFGEDQYRQNDQSREEALTRETSYDDRRRQFLYNIDAGPDYHMKDHPPSAYGHGDQPMFQLKEPVDDRGRLRMEEPHHHPSWQGCENCLKENDQGDLYGPDDALHQLHSGAYEHEYKPIEDLPAGARLAAQVPHDDPVFPYNPQANPEYDTADLDNLQSGDDTFRPHHPDVDRVMNHLQGLPDMSDPHQRLLDRVNDVINEGGDEGSEDEERGRNALAEGINALWGHDNLDDAKAAIDAHFETSQLTHKQHVQQLHDDWEARGGHKTGEPRPVERFSPKFTKPQQIVPDPSNPFPELESPILYAGKCEGCGKKLYDSAGSSGDPRGALGDHTLGTLDAAEYDVKGDTTGKQRMHGPSALICPMCDDEEDRRRSIEDKYLGHKAGDRTGGFHWQWQTQPDGTRKNVRVDHTHFKDRKGKWHNPGEKPGGCYECDHGITDFHRRQASVIDSLPTGIGRSPGQHQVTSTSYDNRVLGRLAHPLHQAHHEPMQDIKDTIAIQGEPGNWDSDPYMHGMFNGMELQNSIIEGRDPEFRNAPEHWGFEKASGIGSLTTGIDVFPGRHQASNAKRANLALNKIKHPLHQASVQKQAETDEEFWSRQPDVDSQWWGTSNSTHGDSCKTCYLGDEGNVYPEEHNDINKGHPFKSFEQTSQRFSTTQHLGETDEEFWARMEQEHPGQQNTDSHLHSDDAATLEHEDEPYRDPDVDWDEDDLDIPKNMSLRDHAKLLRSGIMRWDGGLRYPEYTHNVHREIRDSDGNPAFADESHVIQHNTRSTGPVLPTDDHDEPAPHPLKYPWTHTYYPAGQSSDEGLVKGYNTVDQALRATNHLSVWGARHPKSQELLKGYQYVGSELPYNPAEELPHEAAMRQPRQPNRPRLEDVDAFTPRHAAENPGARKFAANDPQYENNRTCAYYVRCTNPAVADYHHPVHGVAIPTCDEHGEKKGIKGSENWHQYPEGD